MKMTLKEFVGIINEQEAFEVDKTGKDDEAKKLADVFLKNNDKTDEELNSIIRDEASTDNDIVCAKIILNAKNNNWKYKYMQEEDDLFADVCIFKPYLDPDCKVLNQKWHVLISFLAFLDIASFDEDCIKDDKFNNYKIGKIKEIKLENENLKIDHEKKVNNRLFKSYGSTGMIGFIKEAMDKSNGKKGEWDEQTSSDSGCAFKTLDV